jgi:hypothetical protein
MVITYQGIESFKIQFGDIIIGYNPISKESKFKPTRFGADIVLTSSNHEDLNGTENCIFGDKKPFVISGPGEFEVKGVFIRGFLSQTKYGGDPLINTIYSLTLENMNLCFLGAISTKEISSETEEALDGIDILFVPIGGDGVLEASDAYKLAVSLEPKIIIPMHYGDVGEKNALKTFLKEGGAEKATTTDKLTLKKKDLEGKEAEIVVINSSAS